MVALNVNASHPDGVFVEDLDHSPGKLIPDQFKGKHGHGVKIDLNKPMKEIVAELRTEA